MGNFWAEEGLDHIIPKGYGDYPEGFDVVSFLRSWLSPFDQSDIVDLGCGYGRLCTAFSKERYKGLDINPNAVLMAKKLYPDYQFFELETYPKADLYLAYTVFLHLEDHEVESILQKVDTSYFIVAEILGREWRRDGNPPVFNREFDEYLKIFHRYQFDLVEEKLKPYERYKQNACYLGKNTDISFLLFKRKTS
ncbi:MAG: class I SAM-dependent methyltransferase [Chlamydiae bacterium]|nr:class I SAM-dependent methyltransferase [Chlamydiota bacterium]